MLPVRLGLLCVLLLLCSAAWGTEPAAKKKGGDLKWAKGVAEDFLQAMHKGDEDQARLLMTKDFARASEKDTNWYNIFQQAGFRAGTSSISQETLSPEGDEAVFRGELRGEVNVGGQKEQRRSRFALRVVREKEAPRWRVSYFSFTEPTVTKGR
jgi:hypothetical protein